MPEASNFKSGMQLGFARAHHKTTSKGKWAWPWAREAPQYLGFFFNISATAALSSVLLALRELLVFPLLTNTSECHCLNMPNGTFTEHWEWSRRTSLTTAKQSVKSSENIETASIMRHS